MIQKKIGVSSAKNYKLIELINAPNGDFVLIFTDTTNIYPDLFAQVRYIKQGEIRMFAMFKVSSADNTIGLNGGAHELMEFESISISEGVRKCLCASDATTET